MAELLLTQDELDSYLSGVDLEDPANNRVFNSLQLLTTNNYNDLLYYLVNGKITLQQLYTTPINNASARNLIATAEQGGDTILANKRYYEAFLKSLPSFRAFSDDLATSMGTYMYLISYPSDSFIRTYIIDSTGLDPTKFSGVAPIKEKYTNILTSLLTSSEWTALEQFSDQNGFATLLSIASKELKFFEMISTSDRSLIPLRGGAKKSLCGYAARGLYDYSYRMYYTDYLDFVLTKMAEKRQQDMTGNGVVGIRAAQESTLWSGIENPLDAETFIQNLGKTYFVYYTLPSVYGSTYFTSAELAASKMRLERLTGGVAAAGFLPLLRAFLQRFSSELASQMIP
jgi:hypothetical protein